MTTIQTHFLPCREIKRGISTARHSITSDTRPLVDNADKIIELKVGQCEHRHAKLGGGPVLVDTSVA